MERVKKVYRSKNFLSLTVCVMIDGQVLNCEFTGGMTYPQRINGSYSTNDPRIQKQLENNTEFNNDFYLLKVVPLAPVQVPKPPVKPIVISRTTTDQQETVDQEEQSETVEGLGIVSQATNAQQARDELNKDHGVSFSQLKNTSSILAKAKELGITYPNWVIQ